MRFSDKDIVGTYEAIGGSGKYEGMTLKGEFKPLGLPASIVPGTVQFCTRQTGTYKLK